MHRRRLDPFMPPLSQFFFQSSRCVHNLTFIYITSIVHFYLSKRLSPAIHYLHSTSLKTIIRLILLFLRRVIRFRRHYLSFQTDRVFVPLAFVNRTFITASPDVIPSALQSPSLKPKGSARTIDLVRAFISLALRTVSLPSVTIRCRKALIYFLINFATPLLITSVLIN